MIKTAYVRIIAGMLRELHATYPNQEIELRIKETEPNGWQCHITFTDHGAHLGSESFHINPPEDQGAATMERDTEVMYLRDENKHLQKQLELLNDMRNEDSKRMTDQVAAIRVLVELAAHHHL